MQAGGVIDSRRVEENVHDVRGRIETAARRAGRDPSTVTLVAVTKEVPPDVVTWGSRAGLRDFGENYVDELAQKRPSAPDATWHFIGTLQSRTAPRVAELAGVVHSAVPGHALERVARRAEERGVELPALVQIDQAGRGTGVPPGDAERAVAAVLDLHGVRPVGLMTLPPPPSRPEDSRPYFASLRQLRDDLRARYEGIVELSMGMSLDYEIAVEEGATMVRVGTALFGPRPGASSER